MNIALKDSARDKLMPTLKPYMLVGHPFHVGGSINIMQIGKKKQMMYDAEYDRTGKNLGYALNQLASYSNRLAPASLPSWVSVPSLDAPIDEERLRFNTSQKYSINHIKKNKDDAETRIEANYLRTVTRQERENMSIYDLGGEAPTVTTEHNHKTMISDAFNLQWENKVNKAEHYGNRASASARHKTMVCQTSTIRLPNVSASQSSTSRQVSTASSSSRKVNSLGVALPTITMVWRTSTLTTSAIASAPTFGILPTPYSG